MSLRPLTRLTSLTIGEIPPVTKRKADLGDESGVLAEARPSLPNSEKCNRNETGMCPAISNFGRQRFASSFAPRSATGSRISRGRSAVALPPATAAQGTGQASSEDDRQSKNGYRETKEAGIFLNTKKL